MSKNGRHYAPRHSGGRKKAKKSSKLPLIIGLIILLAAAIFAVIYFFGGEIKGFFDNFESGSSSLSSPSESESEIINSEKEDVADNAEISVPEETETAVTLKNGLTIEKLGSYTGIYMEDGSDEVVSGIAMITVKNTGEDNIQYAEITVKSGNAEGKFALSTLMPGQSVVVLEQNRKEYTEFGENFTAEANNVAMFNVTPTLCEDKIKIQPLDGAMNVINISDGDIEGDVVIYYKNSADDMFYGGITYRVRITGGIKNGEIKQIISDHFSSSGSTVVFATIG